MIDVTPQMKHRIDDLASQVRRLLESVGKWRRKRYGGWITTLVVDDAIVEMSQIPD